MMKFVKITAIMTILVLLTVSLAAPSVSASSVDKDGSELIMSGNVYSSEMYFSMRSYAADCLYYDDERYNEFMDIWNGKQDGPIPESLYKSGDEVPTGRFWLVSNSSRVVINYVEGSSEMFYLNQLSSKSGTYLMELFVTKGNSCDSTVLLGTHHLPLVLMILDEKNYAHYRSNASSFVNCMNSENSSYKTIAFEFLSSSTIEQEVSLHFSANNTESYFMVLSYNYRSSESNVMLESIDYTAHVDGVSLPSDSTALSIIVIGLSLVLLVGLLYIANRKMMVE